MIDLLIPLAANGGAPVQTPNIFSPVSTPAIAIREIAFLQPPRGRESQPGRAACYAGTPAPSTGKWTGWITRNDAPRRDIVAGARYYVQPDGESCEFAIAVVDDGRAESLEAGRRALAHRARLNGAASTGAYTEEKEDDRATAGPPAHRRE
jgi:hypothetical protein